MEKKRACCLYRVSTIKQIDRNNKDVTIPMQQNACRKFSEKMGWTIVREFTEEGISGFKVSAQDRDKLQLIKEMARRREFDIFLVYMYDRIGRRADESPFVVEYLVKCGIEVWSTQEGQQRFDTHTDKLLNYIRFWQANGESEHTSLRTKSGLALLVESGHFKGGTAPYGYNLVRTGRTNKRNHETYDLKVNDEEAVVVKLIFDKYTLEGLGAQRIATWLNEHNYRARSGKPWHAASLRGMLRNPTYTGILRSGEARSEVIQELQIISPEQFERACEITNKRSENHRATPVAPLNTKNKSLLTGKVFCGHCGSRLILSTNGRYRKRTDGTVDATKRIRYICYGKTRKQTECDGQTGYTMHILDSIVSDVLRELFGRMTGVSRREVINAKFANELELRKARMITLNTDYSKANDNLTLLKSEVVKAIKGESSFSPEMLSTLIAEAEAECERLHKLCQEAKSEVKDTESLLRQLNESYDELISWAKLYEESSLEKKKMVVNALINRIEVSRDYKVKIDFNFDFEQFSSGLDAAG